MPCDNGWIHGGSVNVQQRKSTSNSRLRNAESSGYWWIRINANVTQKPASTANTKQQPLLTDVPYFFTDFTLTMVRTSDRKTRCARREVVSTQNVHPLRIPDASKSGSTWVLMVLNRIQFKYRRSAARASVCSTFLLFLAKCSRHGTECTRVSCCVSYICQRGGFLKRLESSTAPNQVQLILCAVMYRTLDALHILLMALCFMFESLYYTQLLRFLSGAMLVSYVTSQPCLMQAKNLAHLNKIRTAGDCKSR